MVEKPWVLIDPASQVHHDVGESDENIYFHN